MEIQQSVKLTIHKKKWGSKKESSEQPIVTNTTTPRLKWKKIISFIPSNSKPNNNKTQSPPEEFLCPISGSLMSDPVIVPSGHSFDRTSLQACKNLNFTPQLPDGTTPDFTTLIPNLALKSSILKWTQTQAQSQAQFQAQPNLTATENLLRTLIASKPPDPNPNDVVAHTNPKPSSYSSSSEESIATATSASTIPPLQPSYCYSSSSSPSSSEIEPSSTTPEEEEIVIKLRSNEISIIEEALISLRKLTRTREETRVQLCTSRILYSLRSLVNSKYDAVRVNALASLVNLSLEENNKVRIVRSGIVPPLIEVLRLGSPEAQEHASGALFSLAFDDDNKTAIGVLGALSPLLHALRSESERTRHDSALALYHLSLVRSNRAKLVKLGSVPVLLGMVKLGHMTGRVLLILGNLGSGSDGRAAMLDAGAVECLVGLLLGGSGSTRESCVGVLYALSHGGLRFKAVAKEAGLVEALQKVERFGSEKANEKVRRILEVMREKEVEEEDVDWEELLELSNSGST